MKIIRMTGDMPPCCCGPVSSSGCCDPEYDGVLKITFVNPCAAWNQNPIDAGKNHNEPGVPADSWHGAFEAAAPCQGNWDVFIWCEDSTYWFMMRGEKADGYGTPVSCEKVAASEVDCDCFRLMFELNCPDCCPDGLTVVAYRDGCYDG